MENSMALAGQAVVSDHNVRVRVGGVIAALALVFAMFAVVQERVEAAPAGGAVAASVASVRGEAAQIDFNQRICGILIAVRNAFSHSPFAGFITPILDALIRAFHCGPS